MTLRSSVEQLGVKGQPIVLTENNLQKKTMFRKLTAH